MNYIVKPSDTLISIAEKFGVKLDELIKENKYITLLALKWVQL